MEFSGYDSSLNRRRLDALERGAAEYLHEPVGPVKREEWFGWRPISVDDMPIIGRAPGHRHAWLATGHGMLGVSMSVRSEEHTSELQSLMRISYAVFCLKKKKQIHKTNTTEK